MTDTGVMSVMTTILQKFLKWFMLMAVISGVVMAIMSHFGLIGGGAAWDIGGTFGASMSCMLIGINFFGSGC